MKKLIQPQIKELGSVKFQFYMWVKWKKQVELALQLEPEEFQNVEDVARESHEIIVEKVFKSKMIEVFQRSDIDAIFREISLYIKTQTENPAFPKSGFTLDSIMHIDIDFHKLKSTRVNSYFELPNWIVKKNAVINPEDH